MLTRRQRNLLKYLCRQCDFVTVNSLASTFGVSDRTIRNDLRTIETYGQNNHGFALIRKPGTGILLSTPHDSNFSEDHLHVAGSPSRILAQNERVSMAVTLLLAKETCIYQEIADLTYVSRQTAISDFDAVELRLSKEGLAVDKIRGKGLCLAGSERDIRRCFLLAIADPPCDDLGLVSNVFKDRGACGDYVATAADIVVASEACLSVKFVDNERLSLSISYMLSRIDAGHTLDRRHNEPQSAACKGNNSPQSLELVEMLRPWISERTERMYLASIILSQRVSDFGGKWASRTTSSPVRPGPGKVSEISRALIRGFCETLHITPNHVPKRITDSLTVHLRAAISRQQSGIRVNNADTQHVKLRIPLIYELTVKLLSKVRAAYGISFDQDEVAYIAMYLALVFEDQKKRNGESISIRVLLICSFGLATSAILKAGLVRIIPSEELIGPMSRRDANTFLEHETVDLIISTSEFDHADTPVIVIDPIAEDANIRRLQNRVLEKSYEKTTSRFWSVYSAESTEMEGHRVGDYVQSGDIQIADSFDRWQDAIGYAATPLLLRGDLEQRYVNKMVEAVDKFGTYMVLTPGVAYVHAGVDDGVRTECSAILALREWLSFGPHAVSKDVRAIVVLGFQNHEALDLLNLASIFARQDNIELLKRKDIEIEDIENMHD